MGREPDCARIDELLGRARRGRSGALVIRGEAGLGKTALLDYAAERAEGMTVVRALGVEYEAELQFSGLLELARPLLHHLNDIPEQQADVSRVAKLSGHGERWAETGMRQAAPKLVYSSRRRGSKWGPVRSRRKI